VFVGVGTVLATGRPPPRARARREAAMYIDVVAALDPTVELPDGLADRLASLLRAGDTTAAGDLIPDDLLDRFAICGTPTDIVNHALALFDSGASRVEFGSPHGIDSLRGIELLGRKVLPALRAAR
jgi:5,10-methylenetetrahydromethanopterin reductase